MDIEKTPYYGNVYDLNIDENHNYLTDMGIVHNSGRRPGSFALYLEPHHPEILDFLDLKKNLVMRMKELEIYFGIMDFRFIYGESEGK